MATLYDLTGQMLYLQNLMTDPEADEQAIADTMEGLDMEIEQKADGYAMIKKSMEADIEAIDKEIARLTNRKEMLTNRKKGLMDNLTECMRAIGKTKFKTALFSFGIQKNGGLQPISVKVEPEDLPERFQKVEVKPNNDAIRIALLDGEKLDFAQLEERGESLRIR